MSVTFSLESGYEAVPRSEWERVRVLPCPGCGGHNTYSGVEDKAQINMNCESCLGSGGDWPARYALEERKATEGGEFNVANGNAAYIVQDLLNLTCEDVYGGSIEPSTVLTRLAFVAAGGVREPSESQAVHLTTEGVSLGCRMIDMGRSQRQCDSYVSRLRRLAVIAIERGAPSIVWG